VVISAYLNTRGRERHRDYQFVGPAPPTAWWRAYADHTTFERPTVLVQSDGRDWQAYVSGIPSRRRDAVGTVIRYTVIVQSAPAPPTDGGLSTGDVVALVATWLADQDRDRGAGRVSAVLDAAFPEPDVERWITTDPADPSGDGEVARRVATALHELQLPAGTDPPAVPDDWLAGLDDPAGRAAFVARVDALLAGQPGRALVLNLVGSPDDLAALLDDPRPLAVLAPDLPDPAPITSLARPAPAKKAAPPSRRSSPEPAVPTALRNLRGCLRLILVPIALVPIVLVAVLMLALFGTLFFLR
jgi:hypothetical protein